MPLFKSLAVDITPLKRHRDYRLLYIGQFVSLVGSMITHTALPYQIYDITKSTVWVGAMGIVQLIPLVISGFWGGALADRLDRRKVILVSEFFLAALCFLLVVLTYQKVQSAVLLLVLSGVMATLTGIHRPALTALTPKLVSPEDIPAVSSLSGLNGTIAMIAGPSIGGFLIAAGGLEFTYLIDALSFVVSIVCLYKIRSRPAPEQTAGASAFSSIREGLSYALSRPVLWGSYLVDIIAMTLVFPNPLYPAMSEFYGGPKYLGPLFAATSVGAFIASATSAWTMKVGRHGLAICLAAMGWCAAMIGFGLASNYVLALFFLGLAGFSDMISAVFRNTLWNQTIPDSFRGRLASVEMLSYLFGPLLGSTLMGLAAAKVGPGNAVVTGGSVGFALLLICLFSLKIFINYKAVVNVEKKEA